MGNPTALRDRQHQGSDKTSLSEKSSRGDAWSEAEIILPLVKETATIDKREVVTGKVQVRTDTEPFEELAQANLESQTVEVTPVPIDWVVEAAPAVRTEDDVVIVQSSKKCSSSQSNSSSRGSCISAASRD